ncbi:hypothetical protein M153_235000268 [Pseudoloma neurophilia]|uniref:Yos1-like protein n=1 Tax=Pseudoloma neurophilia TaxID=146866 RepID=A0A0R0LZ90_9MICR|nr:hypothetical protein M153_235000268 [Pseudoloma neurophilia]
MFGLLRLVYSFIFLCNSIVILDRTRFLDKIGLPLEYTHRTKLTQFQCKIIDVIKAIRTVCGIPLIIMNILGIIYEIFLG